MPSPGHDLRAGNRLLVTSAAAMPATTPRVAVVVVELTKSDDARDQDEPLLAYRGEQHVQVIGGSPRRVPAGAGRPGTPGMHRPAARRAGPSSPERSFDRPGPNAQQARQAPVVTNGQPVKHGRNGQEDHRRNTHVIFLAAAHADHGAPDRPVLQVSADERRAFRSRSERRQCARRRAAIDDALNQSCLTELMERADIGTLNKHSPG